MDGKPHPESFACPNRREFGNAVVAGAVGAGALLVSSGCRQASVESQQRVATAGLGRPPMKWAIKHSMQVSAKVTDEELQLAKQLGMEYINAWPGPDQFHNVVKKVKAAGLKVAKLGSTVHNRAEIVLNLPGRDEKIEQFKQHLRAVAALGIRHHLYAHMANGVWSTERETARGGATSRAFDETKKPSSAGSSHNNVTFEHKYTEKELWDNWEYFVKQIVPVAAETGVHIGVHPDDPPGLTLGNLPRPIFSSFEGYRRAIEIADSPYVGMGLCTGCWLEGGPRMGKSVLETIEYFGNLKKLFVVHFRNVRAPLPHFVETYLNEGYMDMYKIMRALRKVDFDGVLIGDHFPRMVAGAGPLAGQIYTIGYIQALIERANEEFLDRTPG